MWNSISRSMSRWRPAGRMVFASRRSQDITNSSLDVTQDAAHTFGEARPAVFLAGELLTTPGGERVEPRLAILLRRAPLGFEPTLLFHAMQCRVERPFFDAQQIARDALHVRRNRVSVHTPVRGECLVYKQLMSGLQNVAL